jgi:hypothetical protein
LLYAESKNSSTISCATLNPYSQIRTLHVALLKNLKDSYMQQLKVPPLL